jgi:hypothetical protein
VRGEGVWGDQRWVCMAGVCCVGWCLREGVHMCFMGAVGLCVYIWLWMDQAVPVCLCLCVFVHVGEALLCCCCCCCYYVSTVGLLSNGRRAMCNGHQVGGWASASQLQGNHGQSRPAPQTRDMAETEQQSSMSDAVAGVTVDALPGHGSDAEVQRCSGAAVQRGRPSLGEGTTQSQAPSEPMRLPGPLRQRAGPRQPQPQRMADGRWQ